MSQMGRSTFLEGYILLCPTSIKKMNDLWTDVYFEQIQVVQEGPVDAAERGAADERQMTPAADSL